MLPLLLAKKQPSQSRSKRGVKMTEQKRPIEPETVSCEVCFKEIPISEAKSVKATDYIMYYCGLDCYDKWSKQEEKPEQ